MEKKIRKLLIGFFAIMMVFTILSRAADAAMVAKVKVDHIQSTNLSYEVSGTGIVKADVNKYINLETGYRIGTVKVKKCQKVKKGDLLFTYDINQLREMESDKKDALEKLWLQYKNIGLTNENMDNTLDVDIAKAAVDNARENVKAAKRELNDIKETVKKNKEKEYKDAVAELEDMKASREKSVTAAERTLEDTNDALVKLREPEANAMKKISDYKAAVISKKDLDISDACNEIYNDYYDDKYKEHLSKVNTAKKALGRAKYDLVSIEQKWARKNINFYDQFSPEADVRNAYYEQVETRKNEMEVAVRAVVDAQDVLDELTSEDKKLADAIDLYRMNVVGYSENITASETSLYGILTKNKLADQSMISDAEKKISRAQADLMNINTEWDSKLAKASQKAEKLQKDLHKIEDGSYDFKEEEKQQKKTLQDAKQNMKTQELQLKKIYENQKNSNKAVMNQIKSYDNERSILQIDINRTQKSLNGIQDIIAENGRIYAPVAGVISDYNLVPGVTLTGQEKLVITTGGYELTMTADKEDIKYFAPGDEIKINTGTGDKSVISKIENIEPANRNRMVSFTAILPKGSYQIGESLSFSLCKDSEKYSICIPIQALRQDQQGTYVLLAKETDSVLGTVDEAFRISVTVLSKDNKMAAVDGALTGEDNIITGSNRNFEKGDRVRIYEME